MLTGNEHVIGGLQADGAESANYLFRCTVTNGDGTATLTADVRVVVLGVPELADEGDGAPAAKSGKSGGKFIPQLGDEDLMGMMAIAGATLCGSLALLLALMRPKKREEEETAE